MDWRGNSETQAQNLPRADAQAVVEEPGEPVKTDAEKYEELARATQQLLSALSLVLQSPEYKAVWELYRVHGFTYRGPTFERALTELADVLIAHRSQPKHGEVGTAQEKSP